MEAKRSDSDFKRIPARKCKVSDIYEGHYDAENRLVKNESLGDLKRVRILGTVTSTDIPDEGSQSGGASGRADQKKDIFSIFVDDGTGVIRCTKFEPLGVPVEVGDLVDVVGMLRPWKEYYNINLEIINVVTDPNFELLHELDILRSKKKARAEIGTSGSGGDFVPPTGQRPTDTPRGSSGQSLEQKKDKVLELIMSEKDELGTTFQKLVDATGFSEGELKNVLSDLLSESSIFEPTKSHYRAL
ncbi:MAG: hypothetical protein ACTSU5_18060 [Promethearchaeota archaeon]